jgi:hypothetical protein
MRLYYRKYTAYPTSLSQLEDTNKIRYIRKLYKDPMSKDGKWKLVHLTDLKLGAGSGLAATATSKPSSSADAFQPNAGDLSSAAIAAAAAADKAASAASQANSNGTGTPSGTQGGDAANGAGTTAGANPSAGTGNNNPASSSDVLGGGPILGVVSKSKVEGIHIFATKTKYNEWFFVYDPTQDKGQQLTGPYNPALALGMSTGNPAATGTGTQNPTAPGAGTTPGIGTTPGGPGSAPITPAPTTPNSTTP